MANYLIQDKTLTDIADAIRAKTGGAEKLAPGDMPKEIAGIETGIQPTGTRNITENGVFDVENYAKALVDVKPTLQEKTATGNGEVLPDEGFDGLSKVTVNIPKGVPKYQNKTVTENGTHTADAGFDAMSSVIVNVPIPEGYVKPEGTKEIDTNGIHDVSGKASVAVNVPVPDGYIQPSGTMAITANGLHDVTDYENAEVSVQPKLQSKLVEIKENGITDVVVDDGFDGMERVTIFADVPTPEGYIKPTGTKEITTNGTHDVAAFASVTVAVPGEVVEEWDGSYTVSPIMLINFKIGTTSYQAEKGMTWQQWCESDYNTGGFYISGTQVKTSIGMEVHGVKPTDVIISQEYAISGGGSND